MNDKDFDEARIRALEHENKKLKATLRDQFAVALTPVVYQQWTLEGRGFNLNKTIWTLADNIIRERI